MVLLLKNSKILKIIINKHAKNHKNLPQITLEEIIKPTTEFRYS